MTRMKKYQNVSLPQNYHTLESGALVGTPNNATFDGTSLWTVGLQTIYTTIMNTAISLYDRSAGTIAQTALDGQISSRYTGFKIKIWEDIKKITFRNNGTQDCEQTYYVVQPRRAVSAIPTNATYLAGGADQYSGANSGFESYPFYEPTMGAIWNKHFKVLKKFSVYLRPGDSKEVKITIPHQRIYDPLAESGDTFVPKFTTFLMTKSKGTLCHDQTDTTTQVGLGDYQIDWMAEGKIRYSLVGTQMVETNALVGGFDAFGVGPVQAADQVAIEAFDV